MNGKNASDQNEQSRAIVHVPGFRSEQRADPVYVQAPDIDEGQFALPPGCRYAERYEPSLVGVVDEVPAIIFDVIR